MQASSQTHCYRFSSKYSLWLPSYGAHNFFHQTDWQISWQHHNIIHLFLFLLKKAYKKGWGYCELLRPSVCQYITLSPPKLLGQIESNTIWFPQVVKVQEQLYFSVHLVSFSPSVSNAILLTWAEFSQTCYVNSLCGKGVQEQHYFSLCPSNILLLKHWVEFNQICYMTSMCGKGMQVQHYFSVPPSVMLSPPKPPRGI